MTNGKDAASVESTVFSSTEPTARSTAVGEPEVLVANENADQGSVVTGSQAVLRPVVAAETPEMRLRRFAQRVVALPAPQSPFTSGVYFASNRRRRRRRRVSGLPTRPVRITRHSHLYHSAEMEATILAAEQWLEREEAMMLVPQVIPTILYDSTETEDGEHGEASIQREDGGCSNGGQ